MIILPAIDLYGGKAVRLYKGNYDEMTVYSDNPAAIAADFAALRLQSVGVAFNRDVVDVVAFNDFDEDAFYEKLDELGLDRGMFFIKATDREGGVT